MKNNWEHRRARLKKKSAGRALLWLFSMVYAAVVLSRRRFYSWGWLKSKSLAARVVCIGNITTGGTGKTPAVLLAAQTLAKRKVPTAILSRGYGRAFKKAEVVTLLDGEVPHWSRCGDEPWMMHQALAGQGIPILVCPDRVKSGEQAVTFYHSRVVILDDGFQHLRLKRDLDVVLLNAADPFGGGHVLPLGNLREPISTLARADMILLTHVDMVDEEALEILRKRIRGVNAKAPILESAHKADFLLDVREQRKLKLDTIAGHGVVAVSGIADPGSFEGLLSKIGATVKQRWRYPDHHPYRLGELRSIEHLRRTLPVVTTLKDFTRFPRKWETVLAGPVYVLAIKLDIVKGKTAWNETLLALAGESAHALEEA